MIKQAIELLSQGKNLNQNQMFLAMQEVMTGKASTAQIVSFLTALNKKGETAEELTAAVLAMRRYVTKINTRQAIVLDTCGTGADKSGTFNISTVGAFVASGCGISVAKHGNRSLSSRCGSADILEASGVNINLGPEKLSQCLDEIGIAFLFAPNLHPAMKYAIPARKEIAAKTIFNLLGPLTNPAGATHQLVGVYDKRWIETLAEVLSNLGTLHALVIHGEDGLDEITICGRTFVSELYKGKISNYQIGPEEFGLSEAKSADLLGGSPQDNARIMFEVLKGKSGPQRDIVLLNSAAALYAADKAASIKEGLKLAAESIDSGRALAKLELLKEYSNRS